MHATKPSTGCEMPLDQKLVQHLISVAEQETVNDKRGKAFEKVAEYIFRTVGCTVRGNLVSPLGSQQIDLAVAHIGVLGPVPNFFFVECKYWEKPVDSAAVGYFLNTCRDRQVKLGVIVSRLGITGVKDEATRAHSLAFASAAHGVNLVVLKESDLLAATDDADFIETFMLAWMQAAATGGVGAP